MQYTLSILVENHAGVLSKISGLFSRRGFNIDSLTAPAHPETHKLAEAINSAPDTAYKYFGNLFEQAVELPEVEDIKSDMLKYRASSAVMTGSGSAVFGLFEDAAQAALCAEKLRAKDYFACVCETVADSFIAID